LGKIFKALEKSQHPDSHRQTAEPDELPEPPVAPQAEVRRPEARQPVETHDTIVTVDPMLVAGFAPQSVEAEQFRLLKNAILFPEKGTPPRCIMVTSASPGEGKSFVSANLAISIAQNIDEHVLLIDCDLRSPSLHPLFGIPNPEGLSEYLNLEKSLPDLLVKTFMNKLTLLPAGRIPPNPSELLSSDLMKNLIQEVRARYANRYIIIDTPPPYLTSETNAISRQVDGIIIVIRQGKTHKKDVMDLVETYGEEKVIGAVYNCAKKPIGYGYSKYGYGKYGYGVKNA